MFFARDWIPVLLHHQHYLNLIHQRGYRRPRCRHHHHYHYRNTRWLTLGDHHIHLHLCLITLLDQHYHYRQWHVRHTLLWSLRYLQVAHLDQQKS